MQNNKKAEKLQLKPLRIALIYLVFSFIWIFLSDRVLMLINSDIYQHVFFQTVKGFAFVAFTAYLIYFLVRRDLQDMYNRKVLVERSEEKYRSFFEDSMEAILLASPSGEISAANPAATKLFGRTEKEICALGRKGLVDTSDARLDQFLSERQATGKALGELRMVKSDGACFTAEISSSAFYDSDGIQKTTVVIRDVTEQKKLMREIIEAKEKAEEMSRLKSNFLSNMSHELRTPLNGILGFTEILLDELRDPEHINMAHTVNQSGKRLLETLNLILDLSRVESNKQEVNFVSFDVHLLLQRVYELFSKSVNPSEINFGISLKTSAPLYSDERIIENILNNLVNNAVKFTRKGFIKISAEEVNEEGKHWVRFSVEDSGIGIKPEDQKLIFEEFRQASEGYNRRFEGTGLGLTISRKYAELLGGRIELQSEHGKGSRFSFYIPAEQRTPGDYQPQADIRKPELIKTLNGEILLVDDDEVIRTLVPRMLKKEVNTDTARDGFSAMEKIKSKSYSLVLLDVSLRGEMDGVDVLKEIRNNPASAGLPVIAFTAFAMKSDREKFLSEGFSGYISKPFSKESLIEVIRANMKQ